MDSREVIYAFNLTLNPSSNEDIKRGELLLQKVVLFNEDKRLAGVLPVFTRFGDGQRSTYI